VAVDLRGDLRVGVPEDLLDRGELHAGLEEERRRRVAQVVEAERLRLRDRPEPHLAARAAARLGVGSPLRVAAPLPPAAVVVADHQASPLHGAAENILQSHVGRVLPAVLPSEIDPARRSVAYAVRWSAPTIALEAKRSGEH
jgi:hypothetical protein